VRRLYIRAILLLRLFATFLVIAFRLSFGLSFLHPLDLEAQPANTHASNKMQTGLVFIYRFPVAPFPITDSGKRTISILLDAACEMCRFVLDAEEKLLKKGRVL